MLYYSDAEAALRVPAGVVDVARAGRERHVPSRAPQPAAVRPLPDAELGVVGLRQPREDEDRRHRAADAEGAAAAGRRTREGRRSGPRRLSRRGTRTCSRRSNWILHRK